MSKYRLTFALAFGLLCLCPAFAGVSLIDLLAGKAVPQTITMKDLTPQWQKVSITTDAGDTAWLLPEERSDPEMTLMMGDGATYYTKGDTCASGGATYLITYRRLRPGSEFFTEQVFASGQEADIPGLAYHAAMATSLETPLQLCLLNVKDITGFLDIRPAETGDDLTRLAVIRGKMLEKSRQVQSISNLKQLALACMMYVQENEEVFPRFANLTDFSALGMDDRLLQQPGTGAPYHINVALSETAISDLTNPAVTPLYYEATPEPDGSHLVAFTDGHVELLTQEQFAALKAKWHLEEQPAA